MENGMKQIEIGVGSLEQGLTEFVRVWRQVEAGERVKEASPRVNFESLSALLAALTRKRLEVLDTFASHPGLSIRALAARLGRDCKNMHGDVSVFAELGLIERSADRRLLSAPYDELVIHAPLKTAA
jgi:predicted transcriptional regulator